MLRSPILLGAALVLAAIGECSAFEGGARARIATDAIRLAPPVLARQIRRNRSHLIDGARSEPPPSSPEDAARRLAADTNDAVDQINSHKPFRRIVETLGKLASTIATLNDPLWGGVGRAERADAGSFAIFFSDRIDRFPLVFDGWGAPLEGGDMAAFAATIRDRYRIDSERLRVAYHPPGGGRVLPEDFDDRSVPFAIASLAYSHAVTDVAEVWIHVWRRANGDLVGTPHLAQASKGGRR